MTREQIMARVDELLTKSQAGSEERRNASELLTGALTLMTAVYGSDSHQVKALLQRRQEIYGQKQYNERVWDNSLIVAVQGALQNLREEVQAGLLSSIERRVASDVLSDLIQLAREALNQSGDGAKNVAAVLAAAAFEDTIRRIAKEHAGVIGQDKLDAVIGKLKDAGLLVAPQLGIALSYLSFRNHALHADWGKIDRAAVSSVLAFVEQLLLKHFG